MVRNTSSSWGSVARWFHWSLGAPIFGMLAYGWWMNHIPARPDRFFYRSIHADIGYLVLLLMVVRLIWRGINPTPALPADTSRWQRIAAGVSHGSLYAVTILVAMLGWAHSGARTPNYSGWFGLFRVPQITLPDKAAAAGLRRPAHLFCLCAAGADRDPHRRGAVASFRERDRVTSRMIDGASERTTRHALR